MKLAERKTISISQNTQKPPKTEKNKSNSAKPNKLRWKEKKELEGIEDAILKTEKEVVEIEAIFADPEFHSKHGDRTNELAKKLEAAKQRTLTLYERWEELESLRQASE